MNKNTKKKPAIKCKTKQKKLSSFFKTNTKGFLVLKDEAPLWLSKIISNVVLETSYNNVYATDFIMREIKYCLSYMDKRFSSLLELHDHYDNNNYNCYSDFSNKIYATKVAKDDLYYINWHSILRGSSLLALAEAAYRSDVVNPYDVSILEIIKSVHKYACLMIHEDLVVLLLFLDLDE